MPTATLSRPRTGRPLAGLEPRRREEIVSDLNTSLAAMIDLALNAKQAHWNVRGPNFQGLHELFDLIAAAARDYGDDIAERAVALGGIAHGTVDSVRGGTNGKFPDSETEWEPLVRAVHERVLAASEQARGFASELDDDLGTQDLYVEIIRGLDKWAWMLEAHLG